MEEKNPAWCTKQQQQQKNTQKLFSLIIEGVQLKESVLCVAVSVSYLPCRYLES